MYLVYFVLPPFWSFRGYLVASIGVLGILRFGSVLEPPVLGILSFGSVLDPSGVLGILRFSCILGLF